MRSAELRETVDGQPVHTRLMRIAKEVIHIANRVQEDDDFIEDAAGLLLSAAGYHGLRQEIDRRRFDGESTSGLIQAIEDRRWSWFAQNVEFD